MLLSPLKRLEIINNFIMDTTEQTVTTEDSILCDELKFSWNKARDFEGYTWLSSNFFNRLNLE